MKMQSGTLIVLTGPSGVGKGILKTLVCQEIPSLKESVSVTTRKKRPSEREGVEYFFVSKASFEKLVQDGDLLEWTEFAGNSYGTPRQFILETLEKGFSVLLEIEVEGALNVRRVFPEAHLIFIEPPSPEALEQRIRKRNVNNEEEISERLSSAKRELEQKSLFDYVIVNDNLEECKHRLLSLILNLCQVRFIEPDLSNF